MFRYCTTCGGHNVPENPTPWIKEHSLSYMSICQNFLFMARPWMIWGVLSLYKDSVTCFCEVSLCSCESKKTIRLTDPTRSLPCPLLPSAALYCSLLPFAVLYLPFNALHCLLLPFTALYCTLLPFTAWGSGS